MANDCLVQGFISHDSKEELVKFLSLFESNQLFETYRPQPENDKADYYTWCTENWGTSREPYDCTYEDYSDEENNFYSARLDFSTAWTPPGAFFTWLHETKGFEVNLCYYESGVGLCGQILNADCSYYNIYKIEEIENYSYDMEEIIDNFPQITEDHADHWGLTSEEEEADE